MAEQAEAARIRFLNDAEGFAERVRGTAGIISDETVRSVSELSERADGFVIELSALSDRLSETLASASGSLNEDMSRSAAALREEIDGTSSRIRGELLAVAGSIRSETAEVSGEILREAEQARAALAQEGSQVVLGLSAAANGAACGGGARPATRWPSQHGFGADIAERVVNSQRDLTDSADRIGDQMAERAQSLSQLLAERNAELANLIETRTRPIVESLSRTGSAAVEALEGTSDQVAERLRAENAAVVASFLDRTQETVERLSRARRNSCPTSTLARTRRSPACPVRKANSAARSRSFSTGSTTATRRCGPCWKTPEPRSAASRRR